MANARISPLELKEAVYCCVRHSYNSKVALPMFEEIPIDTV